MSTLKLAGIMTESMSDTFETEGDEMPSSWMWGLRDKYIHSVGTVAKVQWRATSD